MDVVDYSASEQDLQAMEKKRGFWLTAFLILMLIANPISALTYFTAPQLIRAAYPDATTGLISLLGLLCLVNVLLAVLIFAWKKAGVYGFYAVTVLALILNVFIGAGILGMIGGLLGAAVIYATTQKRWMHFS